MESLQNVEPARVGIRTPAGFDAINFTEWRDAFERMRVQDLRAMGAHDRAVFAVAASAHREALLKCRSPEAARLAREFEWLLEAAVIVQAMQAR